MSGRIYCYLLRRYSILACIVTSEGPEIMRIIFKTFIFILILSSPAFADFYQWVDDKGVLHITDDLHKVPEKYRGKVKIFKTKPSDEYEEPSPPPPPQRPYPMAPAVEEETRLYGDRPLSWWKETFEKTKEAIRKVKERMTIKRQYISVFEGGRRFGQIFAPEDVERYEKYKEELKEDQKELKRLEKELEELRRKATIYGVPRRIRE